MSDEQRFLEQIAKQRKLEGYKGPEVDGDYHQLIASYLFLEFALDVVEAGIKDSCGQAEIREVMDANRRGYERRLTAWLLAEDPFVIAALYYQSFHDHITQHATGYEFARFLLKALGLTKLEEMLKHLPENDDLTDVFLVAIDDLTNP